MFPHVTIGIALPFEFQLNSLPLSGILGLYIADTYNHAFRWVQFQTKGFASVGMSTGTAGDSVVFEEDLVYGRVRTLVGNPNRPGMLDGPASNAKLRYPSGVAHWGNVRKIIFKKIS
jgi:hypothetical protein